MTHGLFKVLKGTFAGCEPGDQFEAAIRPSHQRAISRGAIRFIREVTPTLQAGSYQFPQGWLTKEGA